MQKGGICLLYRRLMLLTHGQPHLISLIDTCRLHAVTALDFFQVIHHHLPLKPVFPTFILFIPKCSSSSLYPSLLFLSFLPGVFFQLLSIPEYTSLCSSAQKQQSQKRASSRLSLFQKSFECSLAIKIKLKVGVPRCSDTPVLFLLLLQQVSFEILQHTQPQIITDKMGKSTFGCLAEYIMLEATYK